MEGGYVAVLLLVVLTVCAHSTIAAPKRSPQVCQQPPDAGPCQLFKTKYYYDPAMQTCQSFSYGGCGGNANNFATQKGCEHVCTSSGGGMSQDVCYMPLAVGGCRQQKTKFFYNTTSEACESFVFNGCGGNMNNFPTVEACTNLCQQE